MAVRVSPVNVVESAAGEVAAPVGDAVLLFPDSSPTAHAWLASMVTSTVTNDAARAPRPVRLIGRRHSPSNLSREPSPQAHCGSVRFVLRRPHALRVARI